MLNPCSACSADCCKNYVITITSFDAVRIMERTGKGFSEFAVLEPLRLLNFDNDTVLECYRGGLRYDYVLALRSHHCLFLKRDRCSIRSFAPLVCRIYPHTESGQVIGGARCPMAANALFRLKGADRSLPNYRKQLGEYRKLVAEWNRKRGTVAECARFLVSRSRKIGIF